MDVAEVYQSPYKSPQIYVRSNRERKPSLNFFSSTDSGYHGHHTYSSPAKPHASYYHQNLNLHFTQSPVKIHKSASILPPCHSSPAKIVCKNSSALKLTHYPASPLKLHIDDVTDDFEEIPLLDDVISCSASQCSTHDETHHETYSESCQTLYTETTDPDLVGYVIIENLTKEENHHILEPISEYSEYSTQYDVTDDVTDDVRLDHTLHTAIHNLINNQPRFKFIQPAEHGPKPTSRDSTTSSDATERSHLVEKSKTEPENKRMCQFLLLAMVALWLTIDTIVDWLFLQNVIHVQTGLVLGPVDKNIQISMTSFCILGTLGWILNITNIVHQCWTQRQFFNGDIVQAVTIWAKNIPQILISNLIASCQEVAVSYYQVVKAGMLLLSHVTMGIILFRKCYRHYESMGYSDTVLRVIISLGLLFAMTGSLGVLLLVHISPVDEFGYVVTFKTPHGDVDMQGYFEDIGIYYKHPTLQCRDEPNWINLASLFDVTDAGQAGFQVTYHHVPHNHTSFFYVEKRSPFIHYKYCYIKINSNCTIHKLFRCPRRLRPPDRFTTVTINFKYLLPDSKRLFGNIVYDMVVKSETSCKTMSGSHRAHRHEPRFGQLRYFQVMPYLTSGMRLMPLLFTNTSTHRSDFYRPRDLVDVQEVWRTGIMACNTTGMLEPAFQGSLGLMC